MVFWHPKGWTLWQQVEQYMRRVYRDNGYQEVRCPKILDRSLWEKSGHWENYKDNMFTTESEKRDFAVKPMNCPGHILIFNTGLRSYRDLPLRYGEFGACHRNEPSGALHGLMRVRGFTQDDGHIFCTEEQIEPECVAFHQLACKVYRGLRLRRTSTGEDRAASREAHRQRRAVGQGRGGAARGAPGLRRAMWTELPGEGAFYGPKIEYPLKDSLGRVVAVGTMQVDFMMPERLGAEYVGEDNARHVPVMLHRAIVGSMERFIGILIEHHAGAMPLWLAPVQVVVMNITDRQAGVCRTRSRQALRGAGLRVAADLRNEKITYKIREHSIQKLPYQLVLGDKEVAARDGLGEDACR